MSEPWFRSIIRKIGDKERTLHIPSKRIREFHRLLMPHVTTHLMDPIEGINPLVEPYLVSGAIKGRSAVANAMFHFRRIEDARLDRRHFLQLDLREAYRFVKASPVAVDLARVTGMWGEPITEMGGYHVWFTLVKAAFFAPDGRGLAFGAPLSPALFNLYMMPFDRRLSELAAEEQLVISRFLDDIWVSSECRIRRSLRREIHHILTTFPARPLRINCKKARMIDWPKNTVTITGVTLRHDGRVGLSRRRLEHIQGLLQQGFNGAVSQSKIAGAMSPFMQVRKAQLEWGQGYTTLETEILRTYREFQDQMRGRKARRRRR